MSDQDEPSNLFHASVLELIAERSEPPPTLAEAEYAGPWRIEPYNERWRVVSDVRGPVGFTRFRETAAMLCATLPGVGRPPTYHLSRRRRGAELMTIIGGPEPRSIGFLSLKDEALTPPLDVVHSVLTSPDSIAWLLLAADPQILARVGEIVARRIQDGGAGLRCRGS